LVVSNIIQTFQTWLISRMPEPDFDGDSEEVLVNVPDNGDGNESVKLEKNGAEKTAVARRNSTASGTTNGQTKKKNKRKK